MQLKPFKEILKLSKEKIDDTLAPVRANKAKKQAELKIAELDEKIATQEQKVMEICTKKDLDFDALISAQDELALLERRRRQFKKIIEELFPED